MGGLWGSHVVAMSDPWTSRGIPMGLLVWATHHVLNNHTSRLHMGGRWAVHGPIRLTQWGRH